MTDGRQRVSLRVQSVGRRAALCTEDGRAGNGGTRVPAVQPGVSPATHVAGRRDPTRQSHRPPRCPRAAPRPSEPHFGPCHRARMPGLGFRLRGSSPISLMTNRPIRALREGLSYLFQCVVANTQCYRTEARWTDRTTEGGNSTRTHARTPFTDRHHGFRQRYPGPCRTDLRRAALLVARR